MKDNSTFETNPFHVLKKTFPSTRKSQKKKLPLHKKENIFQKKNSISEKNQPLFSKKKPSLQKKKNRCFLKHT